MFCRGKEVNRLLIVIFDSIASLGNLFTKVTHAIPKSPICLCKDQDHWWFAERTRATSFLSPFPLSPSYPFSSPSWFSFLPSYLPPFWPYVPFLLFSGFFIVWVKIWTHPPQMPETWWRESATWPQNVTRMSAHERDPTGHIQKSLSHSPATVYLLFAVIALVCLDFLKSILGVTICSVEIKIAPPLSSLYRWGYCSQV